jgi:hypothetical protein
LTQLKESGMILTPLAEKELEKLNKDRKIEQRYEY